MYTPTTEAVRARYSMQHPVEELLQAEFDRWLEAHDRENRAIGWDEAVKTVLTVPPGLDGWTNPYRGDNR